MGVIAIDKSTKDEKLWLQQQQQEPWPPRPPPAWSPGPPCGTAQTAPSGSDLTPTTPAHPTSRVSTLVTTAGTRLDSPPTLRPSPPTGRPSSSTPGGPCSEPSAASAQSSPETEWPLTHGSSRVPSSSPRADLTTSETLPWSTPSPSS